MHTSENPALARPLHGNLVEVTRHGLRPAPVAAKKSDLGTFALVGILGGVTAALLWLKLTSRF